MFKNVLLILAAGLFVMPAIAADETKKLDKAMDDIRSHALVLNEGQFVQDANGCIYNVIRTGDQIQLQASVTTPTGKPVCKRRPNS